MAPETRFVIRWLAWSLATLGVVIAGLTYLLEVANSARLSSPFSGGIVLLAFLIVGALIASRRPRNPLGWLYLTAAILIAFGGRRNLADQYAEYALVTRPGSLP